MDQIVPRTADVLPSAPEWRKSGPEAEERVVRLITEAIQQNRLQPGDRLVERELSDGAVANRQAVRQGLARLAQAGLVVLTPNRGATVVQYSPETIRQIMQARIVNEGAALRDLAETMDDAGRDRLVDILRREAAAYDDGRVTEARHLSRAFHATVMELAGNEMMTRFVNELIACQPLLGNSRTGKQSSFSGVIAHTRTVAALLRKDGAEAEAINTQLLLALEREFLREATAEPG
ncbi:GntR family transcriptional regulator [Paracoccus spongiarum]|uniref:GntR family transcriptional regulator n=1 Tax=Paracoccus spongiarum TaxID=3064387 RepID=A0ABT9J9C5_9RHOB|nr:GntR family transcriptional regulator [Paracoccus sp. 2205BS29-5]MDP5306429.1 GntR family transcriptional regulator [Paracoccus sp. 2205BS29-5]